MHYQVSAKTGEGVSEMFDQIAYQLCQFQINNLQVQEENFVVKEKVNGEVKKGCC